MHTFFCEKLFEFKMIKLLLSFPIYFYIHLGVIACSRQLEFGGTSVAIGGDFVI